MKKLIFLFGLVALFCTIGNIQTVSAQDISTDFREAHVPQSGNTDYTPMKKFVLSETNKKFFPKGVYENKKLEIYLMVSVEIKNRENLLIYVFDKKNKYLRKYNITYSEFLQKYS